jgi:CRP/FNR family transcriptional regulator
MSLPEKKSVTLRAAMKRISASDHQKREILNQNRYFSGLGGRILDELVPHTHLEIYQAEEPVFWEGDTCRGLFIIQAGRVKLYKLSSQGRELIINVLKEGDTFNEVPVFDRSGNPVNAAALDDSQLWVVEASAIRQILDRYPEAAHSFLLNLSQNLRMMVGMIEEMSFFKVTTRLARLLDEMSGEQLRGEPSHRVTQDEMAARIGTVREVVARSLRKLERSGAINVNYGKITIINRDVLREWCLIPCGEED